MPCWDASTLELESVAQGLSERLWACFLPPGVYRCLLAGRVGEDCTGTGCVADCVTRIPLRSNCFVDTHTEVVRPPQKGRTVMQRASKLVEMGGEELLWAQGGRNSRRQDRH